MILERLEVGPFASNCYLVGDEANQEGMIIDPGAGAEGIMSRVKALGLKVKFIVLTHAHGDHIGALSAVKEATDAKITLHTDDVELLQARQLSGAGFGLSPDWLLKGDDSIEIGNLRFLVLHTPGHSPGGICLLGEGVVFSGDSLFNLGIGRTDTSGGSYSQLMDSIHTKLMVLPDSTVVYPGHGPETTIGAERQQNPFLQG